MCGRRKITIMSKSRREYNKYWKTPNEIKYKKTIKRLRKEDKVHTTSFNRYRSRTVIKSMTDVANRTSSLNEKENFIRRARR